MTADFGLPSLFLRFLMSSSSFRVCRWSAWSPGLPDAAAWDAWLKAPRLAALDGDATPPLAELPAMTRRRIDPLGRAALQAAFRAQGDLPTGPVVFVSRWGEIARSVGLLRELAQGQPLSPTAFSLSVHNASSALYSIARGDQSNYTAVAAGPGSAAAGVCEALGLLAQGAAQVLVVSVESGLPEPYRGFELQSGPVRAWAVLLESAERGLRLQACMQAAEGDEGDDAGLPPDLAALRMLTGALPTLRCAGWQWSRDDA